MEFGINNKRCKINKREGWDFLKILVDNCNKRGVECGKNLRNHWRVEMCVEGGFFFSKLVSVTSRLLER